MTEYEWAIVGAGPAGIAAVGQLLDHNIHPEKILWIDPYFQVGDFGRLWGEVPSNTKVSLFIDFLKAARHFEFNNLDKNYSLFSLNPQQTCHLRDAYPPLQAITQSLLKTIPHHYAFVKRLALENRLWHIQLDNTTLLAKNVILSLGADPISLDNPAIPEISLVTLFNQQQLSQQLQKTDTVAVFGSSHSAILALRILHEFAVKKIINFYQSPLRYAVNLNGSVLFDNTGLKGDTAEWARTHIDGKLPENIQRIYSSPQTIQQHLPPCDKVIYAVGFKPRQLEITGFPALRYHETCGILAPGLFGVGIAYPEKCIDKFGNSEYRVGLWKFMEYLQRVIPIWLNYST
ncbi:MAG: pyridine nucleotide-disulfide oxidoreductase [Legionellales bacterium]|nr:pyridine nucleotide-disulfide oxidoreductase [Legionellales bacterium]